MKNVLFCLNKKNGNPKIPEKKYSGDVGWDLYLSRDTSIESKETKILHTDISLKLPTSTFAKITGCLSLISKLNLLVHEGVIDTGYNGELLVCMTNLNEKAVYLKEGTKIAQIIFHSVEPVEWKETDCIKNKINDRNSNIQ